MIFINGKGSRGSPLSSSSRQNTKTKKIKKLNTPQINVMISGFLSS
jgi:hypothetical protein